MSILLLNPSQKKKFETLVKSAGGVLYYDARKDFIQSNGIAPDRSGKGNDVTWVNFAGTGASGLVVENGKVFRRFDGTDDFGGMANTASIDVTSAPLGVFATIKPDALSNGLIICKNLDATANMQYALLYDATNKRIMYLLNGSVVMSGVVNSVPLNEYKNVGFIWDGVTVREYINCIPSGITSNYSGTLISRPYLRIGMRETAAAFYKGAISTTSIYSSTKAIEVTILKAETAISKGYIAA
jgi:hypothetical protein